MCLWLSSSERLQLLVVSKRKGVGTRRVEEEQARRGDWMEDTSQWEPDGALGAHWSISMQAHG